MGRSLYYISALLFIGRWLLDYPWLIAALFVVFLVQRWLPDPVLYARTASHIRHLKIQIAQNAENATARRDLALVWLQRGRPRRATQLLEEARRRDPESAELASLLALALVRSGKHEPALPLLIEAQGKDPKLRYGEIYLTAAIALDALGRAAEAEESLLRYLKINESAVEGWVRLARLRRRAGDAQGAKQALVAAAEAFEQSPRFQRRKQLGWYLRAQLARVL